MKVHYPASLLDRPWLLKAHYYNRPGQKPPNLQKRNLFHKKTYFSWRTSLKSCLASSPTYLSNARRFYLKCVRTRLSKLTWWPLELINKLAASGPFPGLSPSMSMRSQPQQSTCQHTDNGASILSYRPWLSNGRWSQIHVRDSLSIYDENLSCDAYVSKLSLGIMFFLRILLKNALFWIDIFLGRV